MAKFPFIPFIVPILLGFVWLVCCSEGKHDYKGIGDGHAHVSFKYTDKQRNFSTMRICGSFFKKEEFIKYFQECIAQQPTAAEDGKTALSSSSESAEDTVGKNGKRERRNIPVANTLKEIRLARDLSQIGQTYLANHRGHGHWKMFENMHVFKNPCLIPCILEKFQLINSSGHIDLGKAQSRAEEVIKLTNNIDEKVISKARNVTTMCADERDKEEQFLRSTHNLSSSNPDLSSDGMTRTQCRFIIQFGKCIVHNVFETCIESLHAIKLKDVTTVTVPASD